MHAHAHANISYEKKKKKETGQEKEKKLYGTPQILHTHTSLTLSHSNNIKTTKNHTLGGQKMPWNIAARY